MVAPEMDLIYHSPTPSPLFNLVHPGGVLAQPLATACSLTFNPPLDLDSSEASFPPVAI